MRYAPDIIILKARSSQWHKMVWDTPPPKDSFRHRIWNSYLKEYKRYAPDSMPILKTRSRSQWPKNGMWHFVIPRCMHTTNLGFLPQMRWEICFGHDYSKQGQRSRSRSQWPKNGTRHWAIPRCTHTPNLGFLSQVIEICSGHENSKN